MLASRILDVPNLPQAMSSEHGPVNALAQFEQAINRLERGETVGCATFRQPTAAGYRRSDSCFQTALSTRRWLASPLFK